MHVLDTLNTSKLLTGCSVLLMNVGSRYVGADLGRNSEKMLQSAVAKKLIVLSMFFVSTRDLLLSVGLTLLYVLLFDGLFKEGCPICVIPESFTDGAPPVPPRRQQEQGGAGRPRPAEYRRALEVVRRFEAGVRHIPTGTGGDRFSTTRRA
jgi:hypothetical protein